MFVEPMNQIMARKITRVIRQLVYCNSKIEV